MARLEFTDRPDAEELHRPTNLSSENLSRAVDPSSAASHEPAKIRSSNQGRAGAESNRRDDVSPRRDAAVDPDLGPGTNRIQNVGHQAQRGRGSIKLATAMVGQHDCVRAHVGDRRASSTVWVPLMIKGPLPEGPQPFQVGNRHRWVEELVRQLAKGSSRGRQGCERQRACRQEVQPPRRMVAPSRIVRAVSAGGFEKPLRSSRKRLPATGISTVKMRAS